MSRWFGCDAYASNCRRTYKDPRPGGGGGSVTISRSVGVGGVNQRPDVLEIQRALNRVPPTQGGAAPKLAEDSWYGQLTGRAIHRFQTVQFPGWKADGRIDPGQKTIQRLNIVLAATGSSGDSTLEQTTKKLTGPAYSYASVPTAITRVTKAIHRLESARNAYALPDSPFVSHTARRAADWHFKAHKATDPIAHINRVLAIYRLMRIVLNGANLSRLFQLGREDADAVAYTSSGGYYVKPGPAVTPADEPDYYIYVPPSRRAGALVIIHELGHYCGGRPGSGKEIDHRATPIPAPHGKPLEHGVRSYGNMTPDDAYLNTHSYQAFAYPDQSFGKVPANF